jgi:hypothetical protein
MNWTTATFFATPPVNVNSSFTPPERARSEKARRTIARCRPERMFERSSPRLRRSRSSAPAKTVQVEEIRIVLSAWQASGPRSFTLIDSSSAMAPR